MKQRIRPYLLKAFKLYDLAVMSFSFLITAVINQKFESSGSLDEFISMRLEVGNFLLICFWLYIWHEIFLYFLLYNSKRLSMHSIDEAVDITKAVSLGVASIWFSGYVFNIEILTVNFSIMFWALTLLITLISRFLMRLFITYIRHWGRNLNYVLVVGSNRKATKLADALVSDKGLGYIFVGFVDDPWQGQTTAADSPYPIVCGFDGFQQYINYHPVDEVILCVPIKSLYDPASSIVAQCEGQGIIVRFVSDILPSRARRSQINQFKGYNVITVDTAGIQGEGKVIKHSLDFVTSLCLLLALFPAFLLIAVAIRLDSPGPVFFLQERIGLNKRRFKLYKFRTMVADAEKRQGALEHLNTMQGPVFKIINDPRVTRLGHFLRKTSLDELPQLINVLLGDMSLVGPRPLPLRDYQGFDQDSHRRRLSVRPGITCLWQVKGRNLIPFEKWMELDLQYIDQWSLWLDFKILLKTIPAVLRGTGAS